MIYFCIGNLRYNVYMEQRIIISKNIGEELAKAISECEHDKLFVLTDETTYEKCWPQIGKLIRMRDAKVITIKATDSHKDIDSLAQVWQELGEGGATRHSCMINLGGGMVTDLGGFAASTFKRGIDFINIPTTLLSMVDASVGGKTGINFNGLKNEIGVFSPADSVIIYTEFLKTLDMYNILSGYAEMLKHGLISDQKHWLELLKFNFDNTNYQELQRLVEESVKVKENIVEMDPFEKGIRKALNLGHTAGHAFESLCLSNDKPILHGYAVAYGLICELYFSYVRVGFPKDKFYKTIQFIKENYGVLPVNCKDYDTLYNFMKHDKKNSDGIINFTLLSEVGDIKIDNAATREDIMEMLDFYREYMGC